MNCLSYANVRVSDCAASLLGALLRRGDSTAAKLRRQRCLRAGGSEIGGSSYELELRARELTELANTLGLEEALLYPQSAPPDDAATVALPIEPELDRL